MNGRPSHGPPIDILGPTPPPRDLLGLLVVLFVTYSLSFFQSTQIVPRLLFLSPDVWQRGFLWQLVTYPYVAVPGGSFWFLISLLIIFMFGRDVRSYLGRRHFWRLLLWSSGGAALVAVAVQLLMSLASASGRAAFVVMQGDRMLLTILIAVFATVHPNAVIRLFFVLPIRAGAFLWLEILIAFVMGFLPTGDFAGFLGVCTAVGMTYAALTGGLKKTLREWRLRIERQVLELRLRFLRRRRGIRLVKPDEGGDAWRRGDGGNRRGDGRGGDGNDPGPWVN